MFWLHRSTDAQMPLPFCPCACVIFFASYWAQLSEVQYVIDVYVQPLHVKGRALGLQFVGWGDAPTMCRRSYASSERVPSPKPVQNITTGFVAIMCFGDVL